MNYEKQIIIWTYYYFYLHTFFSTIDAFQLTLKHASKQLKIGVTGLQSSNTSSSRSSSSISSSPSSQECMNQLLSWFQGEFDNYPQIQKERNDEKMPPIGHEHIHCTLVPIPIQSSLHDYLLSDVLRQKDDNISRFLTAVYYLDGNPSTIFRSRLYHVFPETGKEGNDDELNRELLPIIRCKIYDFHADIKNVLTQQAGKDPCTWSESIGDFLEGIATSKSHKETYFTELKGCDILWSTQADPIRHAYLPTSSTNEHALHAIMEQEEVLKPSVFDLSKMLRIKDELSLWNNELWINDRGYDANSGELMYGNALNIPYKLKRLCSFHFCDNEEAWKRDILDEDLLWTLGRRNSSEDDDTV